MFCFVELYRNVRESHRICLRGKANTVYDVKQMADNNSDQNNLVRSHSAESTFCFDFYLLYGTGLHKSFNFMLSNQALKNK